MKTAFIGHREIYAKDVDKRLTAAIESEIENGCKSFIMGTHGQFDRIALSVCTSLRRIHKELKIKAVITSLPAIKNTNFPYCDVHTIMYDIEEAHYKRRITLSNRRMIDECDTLICYVNTSKYRSGAKAVLNYAKRQGLKIINLYREEDEPFYGMTKEQIVGYWQAHDIE
ncbi:MAG: hypothetical protein J1F36_05445 [Clostridiales bacterium]|nr:hypothetical protein [Clostridiales bacterium]